MGATPKPARGTRALPVKPPLPTKGVTVSGDDRTGIMMTHRNQTPGRVRRRRFLVAGLTLAAAFSVHADDQNLAEELKLLREQNAALQKQMSSQNGALESLTQKVRQLEFGQSSREIAAGENKVSSTSGFDLGKIHLGAEGAVGFFSTGNQGFAPNAEFRVDEARLLLDAPVCDSVYFFSDIDLSTRENYGLSTQLGELYLDFEDVSRHLWGKDGQLNIRAGRINIPFGEEYLNRYAMENPLVSHSLMDLWGIDPGVELYGNVGKFSYVVAVQNGGVSGVQDFDADKSVTARIGYTPNKHWHFSMSGLRTGELDAVNDYASQLWLAEGWFRSIGSAAATKFHADLLQGDLTARWDSGHVTAYGGVARYGDNDPAADNSRNIFYYSIEAQQNLTKKIYVAARFGEVFADKGYVLPGFGNRGTFFGANNFADNLWRASLGVGWRLNDHLLLKAEYSIERGHGPGGSRDHEDFFGTTAAFRF